MLAANVPQREICEKLHMGRGVLSRYKKAADSQHVTYESVGRMCNEDIDKFLKSTKPEAAIPEKKKDLADLLPEYVSDLAHNRYLTVQKLHERYKTENPDGYEYTQFKKQIRDYQYAHNLSYHNTHVAGDVMQIDFAGDPLWLVDMKTGERTSVVVLVCVLPYSGLGYAKAMYNASMENFFAGISDAFTYIGGCTHKAKSDNMKQWVKKHDRYEPQFTDAALEWGSYYDVTLETCRVRAPRDKGAVEGLVYKVYNAVYSELHDEVHHNIGSLNTRISELMDAFNSKPSRTTGRSRWDIFLSEEKAMLNELPEKPYRFRYRKEVKLTSGYHIEVTGHKYSVPYQYVGKQVVVTWDVDTVEVYCEQKRIAVHTRKMSGPPSTEDSHMPPEHVEYRHGQGYNAAYYLEQAGYIGANTYAAVQAILKRNKHVEQGYASCMGVMQLKKKYGSERLEKACERLAGYSSITYTMIKNILEKNLDMATNTEPATCFPVNDDVRGAEEFCRILNGGC